VDTSLSLTHAQCHAAAVVVAATCTDRSARSQRPRWFGWLGRTSRDTADGVG
jgi:hypothetical protein